MRMLMEWFGALLIVLFVLWFIWLQIRSLPIIKVWMKKSEIEETSQLAKVVDKAKQMSGPANRYDIALDKGKEKNIAKDAEKVREFTEDSKKE